MSEQTSDRIQKLKKSADPPAMLLVAAGVILILHITAFIWIGVQAEPIQYAAVSGVFTSLRWFFLTLAGVFGIDIGAKAWKKRP